MNSKYDCLQRCTIDYSFLKKHSQQYKSIFNAIGEFVDNSRQAGAENLNIYSTECEDVNGGFYLSFLDDGKGMDPTELQNAIRLNMRDTDYKRDDNRPGSGLKSGSVRIGSDFEKLNEVIVPLPTIDAHTQQPWYYNDVHKSQAVKIHNLEMDIIKRYSPFKSHESLMDQFSKIDTSEGTLVVIYNLYLNGDCKPEIDPHKVAYDFVLNEYCTSDYFNKREEDYSLKTYLSLLYYKPSMFIRLQGKKIELMYMERSISYPARYEFSSKIFKSKIQSYLENEERLIGEYNEELRKVNSKITSLRGHQRTANNVHQIKFSEESKRELEDQLNKTKILINELKVLKNSNKKLDFIFGINLNNRDIDGLFIYVNERLINIVASEKIPKSHGQYKGLVGLVNIPSELVQYDKAMGKISNNEEAKKLLSSLYSHMDHFYVELKQVRNLALNKQYWEEFGFYDDGCPQSNDPKHVRARLHYGVCALQCSICKNWTPRPTYKTSLPVENWTCNDSPTVEQCAFRDRFRPIELAVFSKPIEPSTSKSITNEIISTSSISIKKIHNSKLPNEFDLPYGLRKRSNSSDSIQDITEIEEQNSCSKADDSEWFDDRFDDDISVKSVASNNVPWPDRRRKNKKDKHKNQVVNLDDDQESVSSNNSQCEVPSQAKKFKPTDTLDDEEGLDEINIKKLFDLKDKLILQYYDKMRVIAVRCASMIDNNANEMHNITKLDIESLAKYKIEDLSNRLFDSINSKQAGLAKKLKKAITQQAELREENSRLKEQLVEREKYIDELENASDHY